VVDVVASPNVANSAKLYEIDSRILLARPIDAPTTRTFRSSGSFHSHTHTEAYPSPTDVSLAPDPAVALRVGVVARRAEASCAAFTSSTATVEEEPVEIK
jgi:[CysO sulfur-carrier protein]-S-L-cysteine hydrolase